MNVVRLAVVSGLLALVSGCGSGSSSTPAAAPAHHGLIRPQPAHDAIGTRLVVSGHLAGVGGPAPGTPQPWPGTVSWTGPTHGTVRVRADGHFSLSLPPGHYVLTGHSPRFGDGAYACQATHPVVVGTQGPQRMDVFCQLR